MQNADQQRDVSLQPGTNLRARSYGCWKDQGFGPNQIIQDYREPFVINTLDCARKAAKRGQRVFGRRNGMECNIPTPGADNSLSKIVGRSGALSMDVLKTIPHTQRIHGGEPGMRKSSSWCGMGTAALRNGREHPPSLVRILIGGRDVGFFFLLGGAPQPQSLAKGPE